MFNLKKINAMKRFLLCAMVSLFTVTVMAQSATETVKHQQKRHADVVIHETLPINVVTPPPPVKQINKQGRAVTIIATGGTAANAYGLYNGGKTALWVDPVLNAISFIHRAEATPGSGFLMVDKSVDGGATWTGNLGPVYSPDELIHYSARYPQGLIYNPTGNTNPDNAYFVYMAPTLDGTNDNWGGNCFGTYKLDGTSNLQTSVTTTPPLIYYYVPTGMTINTAGTVFGVDNSVNWGVTPSVYNDSLMVYKGVFNPTTQEFEFEVKHQYFLCSKANQVSTLEDQRPAEMRIAFHPTDPNIGYIAVLAHTDPAIQADEGHYPSVLKTTDGGATWSAPIPVPLKNIGDLISPYFISDTELANMFSPNPAPPRSDIWFRAGFDLDLVVDANGNPHMSMPIFCGDNGRGLSAFSVWGNYNTNNMPEPKAIFNIYSPDGGLTWDAVMLGRLMTFRGTFGDIDEDNRPQASRTPDGSKVFFSWNDTDTNLFSGVGNANPDIHVAGFNPVNRERTPAFNVTAGTNADGAAYQGTMSEIAFGNTGTYTIPLLYQDFASVATTATFYYINGFEIKDTDFDPTIGMYPSGNSAFAVSQNYPNPFNGTTNISVTIPTPANVSLIVHNLMGQEVYQKNYSQLAAGTHKLELGHEFNTGIYTYTVQAGDASVTKKMMVK